MSPSHSGPLSCPTACRVCRLAMSFAWRRRMCATNSLLIAWTYALRWANPAWLSIPSLVFCGLLLLGLKLRAFAIFTTSLTSHVPTEGNSLIGRALPPIFHMSARSTKSVPGPTTTQPGVSYREVTSDVLVPPVRLSIPGLCVKPLSMLFFSPCPP